MLNKIKNRLFKNKNNVHILIDELKKVRSVNTCLVLYGSPTKGNWKGISIATKNLFPDNSIEIPQWYSNPVLSEKESLVLINKINELNFEKVIISGFANYFFDWIDSLSKALKIEVIYHGTISEFHGIDSRSQIQKIVNYSQMNKIHSIGFVQKGLAEVFNKLYTIQTYHQPLAAPIFPEGIKKIKVDETKINIGVFGADTFNKNLHNQVIHALLIDNTLIHVLDKSIFKYLNLDERIVEHGKNLPYSEFLSILSSMDLNLYMSYNESWGLVASESEALGINSLIFPNLDYLELIQGKITQNK